MMKESVERPLGGDHVDRGLVYVSQGHNLPVERTLAVESGGAIGPSRREGWATEACAANQHPPRAPGVAESGCHSDAHAVCRAADCLDFRFVVQVH